MERIQVGAGPRACPDWANRPNLIGRLDMAATGGSADETDRAATGGPPLRVYVSNHGVECRLTDDTLMKD